MRYAIVSSSRAAELGRLDAPFNIAYEEHGKAARAMISDYSRARLEAMAKALPKNPVSQRLRAGNSSGYNFALWRDIELALYILCVNDTMDKDAAIREISDEAEKKISVLEELKNL